MGSCLEGNAPPGACQAVPSGIISGIAGNVVYKHVFVNGDCELPVGKVVCVGRNYAEHARELSNPVPDSPILFLKPSTAIQSLCMPVSWPVEFGACHHELEVSVLIGKRASKIDAADVDSYVAGIGLGLDLTLRELQNQLKAKGHPWELAKAFDGSCPLSAFVASAAFSDLRNVGLELKINGETRQKGNTSDMVTPIAELLAYISRYFTLEPGDVVMTGTPAGVGALKSGDALSMMLDGRFEFSVRVASADDLPAFG